MLVSQYRAAHDEMVIEIPAGVRDVEGEADEDNVRRELVEEVGLKPGTVEFLTSIYPSAGMTDSVNSIFLATDLTPVERTPHGPEEEFAEILEIPLREAIEWVESGRIVDAKSVVGLLLADRRLRGHGEAATGSVRTQRGRRRVAPARDRGVPLVDGVRARAGREHDRRRTGAI